MGIAMILEFVGAIVIIVYGVEESHSKYFRKKKKKKLTNFNFPFQFWPMNWMKYFWNWLIVGTMIQELQEF